MASTFFFASSRVAWMVLMVVASATVSDTPTSHDDDIFLNTRYKRSANAMHNHDTSDMKTKIFDLLTYRVGSIDHPIIDDGLYLIHEGSSLLPSLLKPCNVYNRSSTSTYNVLINDTLEQQPAVNQNLRI
jgi:hypothetical protein